MAFSEVRKYQFGDDIRAIDWNVTARKREPFIKVFEEERELTLMLIVDVSGSGAFGSRVQQKREMMTEICATLAFSALTNNDKVGLLLFSDHIEKFIPPVKGRQNVLRIIRDLVEHENTGQKTDIEAALEYLNGILKKKAIVFLLSDFLDEDYSRSVRITAKKHDLTGIRVFDSMDEKLPNLGMIPAIDPESGNWGWLNTGSRRIREKYFAANMKKIDFYRETFSKSGAGRVEVNVQDSYVIKLMSYFKQRSVRR